MIASDAVRPNMMQRVLRRWEHAHPYNAAQVMLLDPAPLDAAVQAAWERALRDLGLGKIRWQGESYWFDSADTGAVACVPPGTALEDFLSDQLNERFASDDALPFRPFLLRAAGACHVGVVYRHWIADSASIRMLMRQWLEYMLDPACRARLPLTITPDGYWRLLGPDAARWRLDEAALGMLRNYSHLRRARRVQTFGTGDCRARFLLRRLPAGAVPALRQAARDARATFTDLLVAVMAGVCARRVTARRGPDRPDLAVGAIVDLRRESRRDLTRTFGLFLGYRNFVLRRDLLDDWPRLLAHVAAQSRRQKRSGHGASMAGVAAALGWGRLIPMREQAQFFRKLLPLSGVISSVNLGDSWAARYHPRPLREYLRVSPTGPMEPLMFTPTTLGDDFHLGLTWRSAIIPAASAAQVADEFIAHLLRLAQRGV